MFALPCLAKDEDKPKSICPKTKVSSNCFDCHVGTQFKLKESASDIHLDYPGSFKFLNYPENPIGYFSINSIDKETSSQMDLIFQYMKRHKVNYLILDIHSAGGTVFDAWKVKGLIAEFQSQGGIVETRVRGMALSAGFILFCAGTKGYRFANPQAELMIHELGYLKGGLFYIEKVTPSSAEEEAAVLKHLQKTICDWFATRGRMTSEEIMAKIRMKEFWISGKEAYEIFGFVDKLTDGK